MTLNVYSQSNEILIKTGLGFSPNQSSRNSPNPIYYNPHLSAEYVREIKNNFSFGVGLKYNYKSFLEKSKSFHIFFRDGREITQQIDDARDLRLHMIGVPVSLRYQFNTLKFQPILYAGATIQYAFSGQFTRKSDLYFDKILSNSLENKYSINDDNIYNNDLKNFNQYTQYFIGADVQLNDKWGISLSYHHNRRFISFAAIEETVIPEDNLTETIHATDKQLQLSLTYRIK